jgi:hypothetical protein
MRGLEVELLQMHFAQPWWSNEVPKVMAANSTQSFMEFQPTLPRSGIWLLLCNAFSYFTS